MKQKNMIYFKYKNNEYKTDGNKIWIIAGEHGFYLSEIKDERMLEILTNYIKGN